MLDGLRHDNFFHDTLNALLPYATGRNPEHADLKEICKIVLTEEPHNNNNNIYGTPAVARVAKLWMVLIKRSAPSAFRNGVSFNEAGTILMTRFMEKIHELGLEGTCEWHTIDYYDHVILPLCEILNEEMSAMERIEILFICNIRTRTGLRYPTIDIIADVGRMVHREFTKYQTNQEKLINALVSNVQDIVIRGKLRMPIIIF